MLSIQIRPKLRGTGSIYKVCHSSLIVSLVFHGPLYTRSVRYISAFLAHIASMLQFVYNMRFSLHGKHFLSALSLTNLITANLIRNKDPFRAFIDQFTKRDNPPWPYGVIGDSWGSGVSYKQDVLYDNNTGNCLRTKEAHGPQMEADTS